MEITEKKIALIKEDPQFFGIIYETYIDEIYRYAFYLAGEKHKAEDVTSMAFMRALEKFHSFSGNQKKLRAWLYRITRNIFIDEVRKKKNQVLRIHEDYEPEDHENFALEEEKSLLVEELVKFITNLEPPIYAEILLMRYKQDLEITEIAEILEKTEQNVRTIIHRATKKLHEIYEMTANLSVAVDTEEVIL
ncbi:RNA polymerase sigma factor [Candidatus Dojkabacteria bacterium]|uniref:RNA polymerase sigma factor n=1 Tax=Candidatus Dojkabacteria bacterium TaxID=2099670 RepID=A0A955RL62_9BACT|nr:RNA polymerase sigma factor [Candidatus Dojkabacteria bacterium]